MKRESEMAPYPLLNPTIDVKHRAKHMEAGNELPVLVTRTPKSDWMIHPDWTDRLAWAGLLPLARMVEATREEWVRVPASEVGGEDLDEYREKHKRFGYDRSLLTCLVDRWRPETHTFHFPWGEMAPTLQDVSYLLGLPLAGQAIGPLVVPDNWREDMQARFAALGPADGMTHLEPDPHGPRFSWLSQFQIGLLGYPGIDLSRPQIDRCLEAYILWLFGKVMFTENHVNTVDARYISIAREIADARYAHDIVPRSFGSAVLAATYRGMCKACLRRTTGSALLGCPLLLQLWSYERFPIGRPNIYVEDPYHVREMDANIIDLPTFGTVWTRGARQYAHQQVSRCYPSFTAQFDTLHEDKVIWQPYTAEEMARRYPRGISNLCSRDHIYWMTKAKIIFDIFVEEMSQQRVMRQFGRRQLTEPVRPDHPLPSHIHDLSRKGGEKALSAWMKALRPYVDSWRSAEAQVWVENAPFQPREFAAYLQMYRSSTRLYLIPTAIPGQMQPPGTSEMYPIESMAGIRHHAGELTEQA